MLTVGLSRRASEDFQKLVRPFVWSPQAVVVVALLA